MRAPTDREAVLVWALVVLAMIPIGAVAEKVLSAGARTPITVRGPCTPMHDQCFTDEELGALQARVIDRRLFETPALRRWREESQGCELIPGSDLCATENELAAAVGLVVARRAIRPDDPPRRDAGVRTVPDELCAH